MKISKEKIERIKEEILAILYKNSLKPMFTSDIASELIRDEEFTKSLLLELEKQKLTVSVKKNSEGIDYSRRIRWRLSTKAMEAYQLLEKRTIDYDEKNHTYQHIQ